MYRRPMPRVLGGSYMSGGGRFIMGEVPLYVGACDLLGVEHDSLAT